jgi:hypothetical protein
MGPEPDFTRRIPGLRIEIWGTRPISFEFSRRSVHLHLSMDASMNPTAIELPMK